MLGAPSNTDGADRVWFDNLVIATGYVGPLAGASGGQIETPRLGLSVVPGSISENGGTPTGTVMRSGSTAGGLTVALASSDTSEATVPSSVTIAAGASSATFSVRGVDDAVVDGAQAIPIRAGVRYTVAVTTGGDARRYYAAAVGALARGGSNGASLSYPANAGVFGTNLSQRPTRAWNSTNYLRDVVFVPD